MMKRLSMAALSLLVLFLSGAVYQVAAQRQEVVVYTDYDFRGANMTLTGDWRGSFLFDRKIKSIRVPRGFRVVMYQERDFRGVETAITEDWNPGPGADWTTRIRSIRVERIGPGDRPRPNPGYVPPPPPLGTRPPTGVYVPPPGGTRPPSGVYVPPPPFSSNRAPVIFARSSYNGVSMTIDRDMRSLGAWDGSPHTIRSIIVPRGWTVTLYTKKNFRGRAYTLTSNVDFRPSDPWYNKIRSIRVDRDNRVPQPR